MYLSDAAASADDAVLCLRVSSQVNWSLSDFIWYSLFDEHEMIFHPSVSFFIPR